MKVLTKLKSFFLLNTKTKLLFVEAFIFLGWARIIKNFPFSKVTPLLGEYMYETSLDMDEPNRKILKQVSQVIHIMSRNTFWESMCFVKAIAALKMLERRKIESTLYLGVTKDKTNNLVAHAWLRSGPFYITGAKEMQRFTIVGKFAKKISPKKC
jgi:hypothetical protein